MERRAATAASAWLRAGAVTVGVGAALAVGSGVACADNTSTNGSGPSSRADGAAPPARGGTHGSRGSASSAGVNAADGPMPGAAARARKFSAPSTLTALESVDATPSDVIVAVVPAGTRPSGVSSVVSAPHVAVRAPSPSVPGSASVPLSAASVSQAAALPAATAVAVVPSAAAAPAARALPVLPTRLGLLLYRIVQDKGLNTPTAPPDLFGSMLWGLFRRIETVYGFVPVSGTPTVSTPSLTTGAVTGYVGFTVPAEMSMGYAVTTAPTQGSVTVDAMGQYTYKPTATATGATDTFTVVANTPWAATAVTVTVPVDLPAAVPGSASGAIGIGGQPSMVVFTPDGRRAYVAGSTDTFTGLGTVSVIDTATKTVIGTVGNGAIPTGIAVSADGSTLYIAVYARGDDTPASVLAFDTTTDAAAAITAGRFPAGVAVSPDGDTVYVLDAYINEGDDSVWVIDTSTKAVIAKVGVGADPRSVTASPDGGHVYVIDGGNGSLGSARMSVIDTRPGSGTANTVTAVVKVGDEPVALAVSPDGKRAYVSDLYDGSVHVIDTATNQVTAKIRLGGTVGGVAVSPDGTRLYVADAQGAIAVIDTVTNTLAGSIAVSGVPVGVAVSPDGSEVYVVKYYDQAVSVISV